MRKFKFAASGLVLAVLLLVAFFAGAGIHSFLGREDDQSSVSTNTNPPKERSLQSASHQFVGVDGWEKWIIERHLQERGSREDREGIDPDIVISAESGARDKYVKFSGFGVVRSVYYGDTGGGKIDFILDELTSAAWLERSKKAKESGYLTVSDEGFVYTRSNDRVLPTVNVYVTEPKW